MGDHGAFVAGLAQDVVKLGLLTVGIDGEVGARGMTGVALCPDQPVLQLAVRLLDVSPMAWQRLLVPAAETLRDLHGILQVAMGWEGIHLYSFEFRARRCGSLELCTGSPAIPLAGLRLRVGSKRRYTYDMGDFWRHEVRVEDKLAAAAATDYPLCLAGDRGCPVEDSGGPPGWRERRRELTSYASLEDIAEIRDMLATVATERTLAALDDPETRERFEAAAARMQERERWLPQEFCRMQVNDRFCRREHKRLMHQQVW